MDKKTTATTLMAFLILLFFIVFGATLSAYKVAKEKVEIESIEILASDGISVSDKEGNQISSLKIKSSSVGIRPATGEESSENTIPTTVNDQVGTEGAYACFYVTSQTGFNIVLTDCSFANGFSENIDNVKIGIMESDVDAISGSDLGKSILKQDSATNNKLFVVVAWLDKDTTKSIAGSNIKIKLEITPS